MKNKYIYIYIIFSLILQFECMNDDDIDEIIKNYDLKYEESLRKFLKNYLIENNLLTNDRLIEPDEMKKIFFEIMLEGGNVEEIDDYTKYIYEELTRIFINKYYKRKKIIRGKDIYDLIDINEISQKYYQLNGEIPFYDEDDDINGDL